MIKASHIPMNWAYDEDDARIYYDDGNVQPTIAYVEREGVAPEQVKADGYLLAAAPALREEAKSDIGLVEFLEEQLNICTDNFESWRPKDTKAFLADLRHAVGKRDMGVRAAVGSAGGPVSSDTAIPITLHIEGGLVQDVTGIPAGYELRVEDYDTQNPGDDSWDAEKECVVTVYGGEGV